MRILQADGNSDNNIICPVKLLVIMGLRIGCFQDAKTISQLLERVVEHKGHIRMTENSLKRPVIAALDNYNLVPEKGALVQRLAKVIRYASQLAGIPNITHHATRRGVARELYLLPKGSTQDIQGEDHVANLLAHSKRSRHGGVTQKYIGGPHQGRESPCSMVRRKAHRLLFYYCSNRSNGCRCTEKARYRLDEHATRCEIHLACSNQIPRSS